MVHFEQEKPGEITVYDDDGFTYGYIVFQEGQYVYKQGSDLLIPICDLRAITNKISKLIISRAKQLARTEE